MTFQAENAGSLEWNNYKIMKMKEAPMTYFDFNWNQPTQIAERLGEDSVARRSFIHVSGDLDIHDDITLSNKRTCIGGIQAAELDFYEFYGSYFCTVDLGEPDKQHESVSKLLTFLADIYNNFETSVGHTVIPITENAPHDIHIHEIVKDRRFLCLSISKHFWDTNIKNDYLKKEGLPRQINIFPTSCWLRISSQMPPGKKGNGEKFICTAGIKWNLGLRPRKKVSALKLECGTAAEEPDEEDTLNPPVTSDGQSRKKRARTT